MLPYSTGVIWPRKGEKMHIVFDEVESNLNGKRDVWYEVYVVDANGAFISESDEIYKDMEKAFDAIKRLVREYL